MDSQGTSQALAEDDYRQTVDDILMSKGNRLIAIRSKAPAVGSITSMLLKIRCKKG